MQKRIIKFRAWYPGNEKEKGGWIQGFNMVNFHNYYNKGSEPTIYRYSREWKLSEIVLCQFTGHQINGADLYESDIVRLEENADGVDPEDKMTYYVVVWLQEWCMFALLRAEDEYSDYLASGADALDADSFWTFPLDPSDTETSKHYLCGNIYEHSELLTQ